MFPGSRGGDEANADDQERGAVPADQDQDRYGSPSLIRHSAPETDDTRGQPLTL
jgi:hypothetical protein